MSLSSAEECERFVANPWRPEFCRECFRAKTEHASLRATPSLSASSLSGSRVGSRLSSFFQKKSDGEPATKKEKPKEKGAKEKGKDKARGSWFKKVSDSVTGKAKDDSHIDEGRPPERRSSLPSDSRGKARSQTVSRYGGAREKCYACGKPVYELERLAVSDGVVVHRAGCFRCVTCNTGLALKDYVISEGVFYCKQHGDAVAKRPFAAGPQKMRSEGLDPKQGITDLQMQLDLLRSQKVAVLMGQDSDDERDDEKSKAARLKRYAALGPLAKLPGVRTTVKMASRGLGLPEKHVASWIYVHNRQPPPGYFKVIEKEGILLKQITHLGVKKWHERLFFIVDGMLVFWEILEDGGHIFRGCVSLYGAEVADIGVVNKAEAFSVAPLLFAKTRADKGGGGGDSDKVEVLAAKSHADLQKWLSALRTCVARLSPSPMAEGPPDELEHRLKVSLAVNRYIGKLADAIRAGDAERAAYFVQTLDVSVTAGAGSDPPTDGGDLMQPLHLACLAGQEDIARELISMGADIGARSKEGKQPLHYSYAGKHLNCALLLLANGADCEIFDQTAPTEKEEDSTEWRKPLLKEPLGRLRDGALVPPGEALSDVSDVGRQAQEKLETEEDAALGVLVRAAHVDDLLAAAVEGNDADLRDLVLLALPCFSSAAALLRHVEAGLHRDDDAKSAQRMAAFLDYWVGGFFDDFHAAATSSSADTAEAAAALQRLLADHDVLGHLKAVVAKQMDAWSSLRGISHSTALEAIVLVETDLEALADQITLKESMLYRRIRPRELVGQAFSKNRDQKAQNVTAYIDHFNKMSAWAETQVLMGTSIRVRARTIEALIKLLLILHKRNNFNACMWVGSALQSTPIYKLKKTWETVASRSPELMILLECFRAMQEPAGNYRVLARKMEQTRPPAVPFLGMYLTQLTFADDGASGELEDGRLNLRKHYLASSIIRSALLFQQFEFEGLHEDKDLAVRLDAVEVWDQQTRREASASLVLDEASASFLRRR